MALVNRLKVAGYECERVTDLARDVEVVMGKGRFDDSGRWVRSGAWDGAVYLRLPKHLFDEGEVEAL